MDTSDPEYNATLNNLRDYYQYNRDILMESSTVIFWAELHWKHIYVRRAYLRWFGQRSIALGAQ